MFAYKVPDGTNHWVQWFLLNGDEGSLNHANGFVIPDEEINKAIEQNLKAELGHDNFEFVWYLNPKPSLTDPDLFHVQVFWIEGKK
jgi:hypothetical protein